MAGLVPAIPISLAQCPPKRDRRNKPALGRDPSVQRSRKRYPFSRCVCIRVLPKPRQNFFRPFPRKRESSLGPRLRGDERRKSCLPKKGRRSADRRIHSWPRSFRARRQAQRSPPASRRSTAALARGFRPAGSAPGHASWDVDPAHDPGKLALGLDPGVVFRFPDKIMRKTRSSRHGHAAVSPAGRYPPSPVPVQGLHLPHRP
jgi:hypothetical protein